MGAKEIYHYGIKGMHWGERRTPEQLGHRIASGARKLKDNVKKSIKESHTHSEDYDRAHKGTKNVKKLSDAELRNRINRINMEKQYKSLRPSVLKRGGMILAGGLAGMVFINKVIGSARGLSNNVPWAVEATKSAFMAIRSKLG